MREAHAYHPQSAANIARGNGACNPEKRRQTLVLLKK